MNLEPIDTSTTAGKARVMHLASEGRKVEIRSRLSGGDWGECPSPVWDWSKSEYAIVAEPVGPDEFFVVLRPNGTAVATCDTMERASNWTGAGLTPVRYVRADLAGEVKS